MPNWNHGGCAVVPDSSGIIAAGTTKSGYNGPCPPSGRHRYEFSVKAMAADGSIVGFGKAMRLFPPTRLLCIVHEPAAADGPWRNGCRQTIPLTGPGIMVV